MKYAIETAIRDFYKADSDLDEVKLFIIGEPVFIELDHYPAIIIFVEQQVPFDVETGI